MFVLRCTVCVLLDLRRTVNTLHSQPATKTVLDFHFVASAEIEVS